MDKKDCKVGMFVAVVQNTSSLSKNRAKVKRIGKIVGVYGRYANLLLFDSDFSEMDNIIIRRELYNESFRFSEIFPVKGNIKYEE